MVKLKRFITAPNASVALSLSSSVFFLIQFFFTFLPSLAYCLSISVSLTHLTQTINLFLLPSYRNCLRIRKDNRLEARLCVSESFFACTTPTLFACDCRKRREKPFFLNLAAAQKPTYYTYNIYSPTDSCIVYSNAFLWSMKKEKEAGEQKHA